jgi:hypothetical protein
MKVLLSILKIVLFKNHIFKNKGWLLNDLISKEQKKAH